MSVIHGRNSLVPRAIQFNTFLEVAKLADYYECGEALYLAVEGWIRYLHVPCAYNDSAIQWVFISLVFRLPRVLKKMTLLIFKHSTSAVTSADLPISDSVLRGYSVAFIWSQDTDLVQEESMKNETTYCKQQQMRSTRKWTDLRALKVYAHLRVIVRGSGHFAKH